MTYRELLQHLENLPEDRLDDDVSILLMYQNEVYPIIDFVTNWNTEPELKCVDQVKGVIPDNSPYFTVDD